MAAPKKEAVTLSQPPEVPANESEQTELTRQQVEAVKRARIALRQLRIRVHGVKNYNLAHYNLAHFRREVDAQLERLSLLPLEENAQQVLRNVVKRLAVERSFEAPTLDELEEVVDAAYVAVQQLPTHIGMPVGELDSKLRAIEAIVRDVNPVTLPHKRLAAILHAVMLITGVTNIQELVVSDHDNSPERVATTQEERRLFTRARRVPLRVVKEGSYVAFPSSKDTWWRVDEKHSHLNNELVWVCHENPANKKKGKSKLVGDFIAIAATNTGNPFAATIAAPPKPDPDYDDDEI